MIEDLNLRILLSTTGGRMRLVDLIREKLSKELRSKELDKELRKHIAEVESGVKAVKAAADFQQRENARMPGEDENG